MTLATEERTEGIDFDFYADMNDPNDTTDHQFERNKKNVDLLLQQQELYQTLQGMGSKSSRKLENVTQMPDGQRIVPPRRIRADRMSRRSIKSCRKKSALGWGCHAVS